jgi:hypothetical protein
MPNQRKCHFGVGQWAAYYKVIVAMYQNAAIVSQLVLCSF